MAYSIVGDSSRNILSGTPGEDLIDGKDGNDDLYGMEGNDTLIGGAGSDALYGGDGNDLFLFNRGDGRDIIRAYGTTTGVHDRIGFGAGIVPDDLLLQRFGAELVIQIRNTTDRITVERFFEAPLVQNGEVRQQGAIDRISFADGMQWNREAILTRLALDSAQLLTLGAGNEQFSGYGNVDGGAGNDTLQGNGDTYYINGGAGDDRLVNSSGGALGVVLLGGDGNDTIISNRTDDLIDGGRGNDMLDGGAGNNTYLFSRGWGQDRLQLAVIAGAVPGYHNIVLGDVLAGGVALSRTGAIQNNDLLLTLRGGSDTLTLVNYGSTPDLASITFADGTVWNAAQIAQALAQPSLPERLGTAGADTLAGGGGSDVLSGGDGNDQLHGMDGNDVLNGGNGDDFLSGGVGDDTLIPGPGRDQVDPGEGSNLLFFGRDNGLVTLLPRAPNADNTIVMGADVRPADVSVLLQGQYQLVVRIAGSAATLEMRIEADTARLQLPAQIRFADGTRWDQDKLLAMTLNQAVTGDEGDNNLQGYPDRNDKIDGKGGNDKLAGLGGDDVLNGGDGNDTLDGGDGDDTLNGDAGDDVLTGGAGRDLLSGGAGNNVLAGGGGDDIYLFAAGEGISIIDDAAQPDGTAGNVLRFGAGVYANQVQVINAGSERHLYDGKGGQIKLLNQGAGFSLVEFADGTIKTIDQLSARMPVLTMPLPDAAAIPDIAFTLQFKPSHFFDPDVGDVLTYKAARADGAALPAWLKFDAPSRTFSGTPGMADMGALDVKVIATDSTAQSASDIFRVTVGGPNVAPTLRFAASDMTVPEKYGFSKRLPEFQDANPGDALSIAVRSADGSALPAWMWHDTAQSGVQGAPGYDDAGTYPILVTATDKGGLSASSIFNIIITDVNRAPVLAKPIPDAAATPASAFKMVLPAGTFADPDTGAVLILSATLAGGAALPQWLRFDPATATFSGTPGYGDSGVADIVVRAIDGSPTDSRALAASDTFRLNVAEVNTAPAVVAASAGATVTEGQAFSVAAPVFADPNPNDVLALALTRADGSPLPAWMSYNPATGTISGTPGLHDNGTYLLKASATDKGGLSASSELSITVLDSNHAPVMGKPLPDFGALSENIFGITLGSTTFSDPDSGDVLTLTASLADGSPLPTWFHFNPSGRGSFTGFPTSADVGAYDLRITATDQDGLSVSDVARMTIEQNLAPVLATSGGNASVAEGGYLIMRPATFTDPNKLDAMNLVVTRADGSALPAWMSYDARNNYVVGTAGYDDSGTYALKVTATDLGGLSASSTFDIVVNNTNRAPLLAEALADSGASAGSAFTRVIAPGAFADPDAGDALTLGATLADGAALPQWLRFDAASGIFSGTPDHADSGVIEVRVVATDSGALTAGDSFRLTVADFNVAPTVRSASAGVNVAEGASFSAAAPLFQDANPGDALSVAVTRADGSALPAWMAFDAASGTLSGTAGYSDSGVYALAAVATDKAGLSVSSPFSVNVANTNRAPLLATPIAAKSMFDNTAFNFTVPAATFSDPDAGDSGLYSAANLPSWLAFNPATRTFTGTPAMSDAGTSSVTVRYTDAGGLAATASFALTVNQTASVTLTGSAAADILTGKSNNDTLYGLGGDDKLDGGLGADTLVGGAGNDSYIVDHAGDVVTESAGAGTDTVTSSVSYSLPVNVEHLTLTGGAAINATGNTLNNTLTGNAGANVLNGGAGGDVMIGNGGDDTYYVDSTSDVVTEYANGGFDQLFSSVNRSLPANVEALTLTGTSATNGTGNSGNNLIVGNSLANVLNGLAGVDLLFGGAGNDALSDNSAESNLFSGGSGADSLTGGAANELFIGGAGNDSVNVQGGRDIHAFNRGDGQDVVTAFGGNDDTVSLGHGIVFADLALKKVGAELILMTGAGDQITFKNWYGSSGGSVSTLQVVTAGGADYQPGSASVINDNKVELFDFAGLVGQFNQARAANPALVSWNVAQSLAAFARGGSDSAAIGGDLAYHYAVDGNLAGVGAAAALTIVGSAGFGSGMQTLLAGAALADGLPLLY
ncbi:MAG TPA: putative Ig domain-containing protein [Telluria sp.]|jgi:Ca2+-binding RTX toxin-like protein